MRISAGELELRYKLKHLLLDFFDRMKEKMYMNLHEKSFSWRKCPKNYLKKKLLEHLESENWISVANYAFMLNDIKEVKT